MARKKLEILPIDKMVGGRIQTARLLKGLSRQELATAIGVTHQQLQKYEKGINRITVSRLSQVAAALMQPIGYFLEDNVEGTVLSMPPDRQRACIEMTRNFANIKSDAQQEALGILMRVLASAV